jgi:hypothetical protein
MLRKLTPFTAIIFLSSCTALKLPGLTNKSATSTSQPEKNREVKFLDNINNSSTAIIAVTPQKEDKPVPESKNEIPVTEPVKTEAVSSNYVVVSTATLPGLEKASALQFKYALLMNTNVEEVQNLALYKNIDDWYGTKYRLGGTTKKGIDCSALVQNVFITAFGITLPRTARDQYKATQRISTTELQEGDLLFFNTRHGVSHVGIYLQNNKFVHASVSNGVMISDMFEPYFVKRFIGAGRVARPTPSLTY